MEKDSGVKPRALRECPVLRADCVEYFDVFDEISSTRGYNEAGMQPLEPSEILAYLGEGLDIPRGEARETFLKLMLKMDRAYMAHVLDKQNTARTANDR